MSQEKVDRYKKQKANRQEIMKKEKREKMLWKVGTYVVLLAIVCWIGYSAYDKYHVEAKVSYELDTTSLDDYLNGLAETETETETAESETETEAAESETEAAESETEETESEAESETAAETETAEETETEAAESETEK